MTVDEWNAYKASIWSSELTSTGVLDVTVGTSGRYVRIDSEPGNSSLRFNEVQVFGSVNEVNEFELQNVALDQDATQSSRSDDEAIKAINGQIHTGEGTRTDEELNPWWQVDLGSPKNVSELVIYQSKNRLLTDFSVLFSNGDPATPDHQVDITGRVNGQLRIVLDQLVQARYVRIQVNSTNRVVLELREVQVLGN
jgi:hypothetical protein